MRGNRVRNCFRAILGLSWHRLAWAGCLLTALGCDAPATKSGTADAAKPATVRIALNWLPEIEHGGYYAALLGGEFAAAGLEVEIIPGGPDAPVIQQLATGRVELGLVNADRLLMGRAQGADLIAVFSPLQHSPRCLMAHADTGFRSLSDLRDVTLAVSESDPFSHVLRDRVSLTGVRIVRNTGNIANFLLDPRFVQQGYVFSEPVLAAAQGARVTVLPLREIGFDPYTSTLAVLHDWRVQQSAVLSKVVRACQRGWRSYLADPTAVHAHLKTLNPELDASMFTTGFERLVPLCQMDVPTESYGTMTLARWQELGGRLQAAKLLTSADLNWDRVFTNAFVPPPERAPAAESSDKNVASPARAVP